MTVQPYDYWMLRRIWSEIKRIPAPVPNLIRDTPV
jgi:hypothetical protein